MGAPGGPADRPLLASLADMMTSIVALNGIPHFTSSQLLDSAVPRAMSDTSFPLPCRRVYCLQLILMTLGVDSDEIELETCKWVKLSEDQLEIGFVTTSVGLTFNNPSPSEG